MLSVQDQVREKLTGHVSLAIDHAFKQVINACYGSNWALEQLKADKVAITSEPVGEGWRYTIWQGETPLAKFLVSIETEGQVISINYSGELLNIDPKPIMGAPSLVE